MHKNTIINWSIEFGPIILFFISLSIFGENDTGFILSTALFTGATVVTLLVAYIRDKRVALFPILSGVSVIIFGITTVYFNNPKIFIIKDTVYNGLFAIALLIGLLKGKGLLQNLFGSLFDMKEEGWKKLSFRWMIMFTLLAVSNEFVWRTYTQDMWVMYKFFATIATTVFGSYQIYLSRVYRNPRASPWGMRITSEINNTL